MLKERNSKDFKYYIGESTLILGTSVIFKYLMHLRLCSLSSFFFGVTFSNISRY